MATRELKTLKVWTIEQFKKAQDCEKIEVFDNVVKNNGQTVSFFAYGENATGCLSNTCKNGGWKKLSKQGQLCIAQVVGDDGEIFFLMRKAGEGGLTPTGVL